MNLALYSGESSDSLRRLEAVIEHIGSHHEVRVFRNMAELRRELHRPGKDIRLIILNAANRRDLEDLLLLKEMLHDIRVVLILPDLEETTLSLAHKLHPRFLAGADSNRDELGAILNNMIKIYGKDSISLKSLGEGWCAESVNER
jgi:hypothetical protein